MHLCPHCCCTTMMALPQTGSDTGIRTQDLRGYEPDEDDLSSISQQIGAGAHLLLSGFTRDYPDENRPSKGFLKGSGRFNYPACLSYKLAGSEGFEPSTVGLTGHRTYLMCFLPNTWWILLESNQQPRRARFYRPLRLTTLPIRSRNLVRHVGFEPTTLWSQTRYATGLR